MGKDSQNKQIAMRRKFPIRREWCSSSLPPGVQAYRFLGNAWLCSERINEAPYLVKKGKARD